MIAPAKTGNDNNSKIVVIRVDQIKSGICSNLIIFGRMFMIVVMKLIAPKIDDTPAKWREKIVKSTLLFMWNGWSERGGYTVQPVPAPESTIDDISSKEIEGGSNQNLMLFIRGNAISGADKNIGTSQFPNPPIIIGITIKKIITKAWAVTITL